jgi:3-dehydroquinate synthetase
VEIKGEIVQLDEREAGKRSVLNFGHTVGHAVEKALGHSIDHGRAVAVGMLVEGRVALARCGLPAGELARLRSCLGGLGLPTRPPELSFDVLVPFLAVDKKRRGELQSGGVGGRSRQSELQLALPKRIGVMARSEEGHYTLGTDLALVREAWDEESRA